MEVGDWSRVASQNLSAANSIHESANESSPHNALRQHCTIEFASRHMPIDEGAHSTTPPPLPAYGRSKLRATLQSSDFAL